MADTVVCGLGLLCDGGMRSGREAQPKVERVDARLTSTQRRGVEEK